MTPIINPMWFYLFYVFENIKGFLTVVGILCGVGAVCAIVCVLETSNETVIIKKAVKAFIIGAITIFLSLLIPNQKTSYAIMAASMLTPDNITIVGETTEDIVDYIVESVDTLLEESK